MFMEISFETISEKAQFFFAHQPVKRAFLFGSYSQNTQTENSDIDILIELEKEVGLFRFAEMKLDLENLFHKKIDLISENGLSPYLRPYINQQKILIYEKR